MSIDSSSSVREQPLRESLVRLRNADSVKGIELLDQIGVASIRASRHEECCRIVHVDTKYCDGSKILEDEVHFRMINAREGAIHLCRPCMKST